MELKTDTSHKKVRFQKIDYQRARKIQVGVSSVFLSIALLSGCGREKPISEEIEDPVTSTTTEWMDEDSEEENFSRQYDIVEHSLEDTISISDYLYGVTFDDDRRVEDGIYTYEDLSHITSAIIIVKDDGDYSYLNYMTNLKNLMITDLSNEVRLQNIDGSRFPSGISIQIDSPASYAAFNEERYGFLKDISSIDTLEVGHCGVAMNLDSHYLQSLRNVHRLSLALDITSNFQYEDLTYLDSLMIDSLPYDAAMYFSNAELDELENSGVTVTTIDQKKLREINQRIEEVAASFHLSENATDQEKLNAILTYVLEEFTYDEEVHHYLEAGLEVPDELNESFYEEGELTGAFERDSQICGNYAAMTSALGRELGLNVYNLISENHAWNAVEIGDYYYYVDPTWLDGTTIYVGEERKEENDTGYSITIEYVPVTAEELFLEGNQEKIDALSWYMEDPTAISEIDNTKESHEPLFVPERLVLESIPTGSTESEVGADAEEFREGAIPVEDISNQKFKVTIDNKGFIIGGAALVGILSSLGVGILVHKKQEEKRRKERMRQQRNSFSTYDSYPERRY